MGLNGAVGVLLAAVLALATGTQAQAQSLPGAIPSPWNGSIAIENPVNIGGNLPGDASWEQDQCIFAYSLDAVPEQAATLRRELANEITAYSALAREQGRSEAEIETLVEERFGEYRTAMEKQISRSEQMAASAREGMHRCVGTFFRSAVEHACREYDSKNRFCAQLGGTMLPGVRFSTDRFVFAHALAATHLGFLDDSAIAFAPKRWGAAFVQPFKPPRYGLRYNADGSIYFETENGPRLPLYNDSLLYGIRKERADQLAAASKTGIGFIYATNEVVNRESGEAVPGGIGQWAFSIEMERALKTETATGALDIVRQMERSTGFVGDLGEYAQLPRIHFQAHMPDILVQSDYARFVVEKSGGSEVPLHDNAWFESPEERRAFFFTSSPSYRIHASMMPTPDEMAAILAPDAAYLVAHFEILLRDGSIDLVTLRTPLAGIAGQWAEMNAANRETRALIARKASEWDSRFNRMEAELAADQVRRERERRLALQNAEKAAREYLASNPFVDNCPSPPRLDGFSTDAASANRIIGAGNACRAQWLPKARDVIAALGRLQRRYASFGGTETFISDERARWRGAVDRRNGEVSSFNLTLAEHNRRVSEHNIRVASQARVAVAGPSPSVRRRRSYERRRSSGREWSAADEFYASQGRPYRSMFRDVTIPPTPTGYMGTGYW